MCPPLTGLGAMHADRAAPIDGGFVVIADSSDDTYTLFVLRPLE